MHVSHQDWCQDGKPTAHAGFSEKKRYAAYLGDFVDDPALGAKLAHRCMYNKRSRACLALYTAIDIAHQLLCQILARPHRGGHSGHHGSAGAGSQRDALKQAINHLQRDLVRIRGFLRPIFLDRRSFSMQFSSVGDIDDEQLIDSYGQLGGAALHRVMVDATFQAEQFLQQHANVSLTWAVMLAIEPEMQAVQDKLMPQHAHSLETNAFIGCIFRLEWKKTVAEMPPHLIAKHIVLILNVPASIRVPATYLLHSLGPDSQPDLLPDSLPKPKSPGIPPDIF
jgi:hypothetical protein